VVAVAGGAVAERVSEQRLDALLVQAGLAGAGEPALEVLAQRRVRRE
jgi:hypothetical protein